MEIGDLEILGVKYYSDRKRLMEAQRLLKSKGRSWGPGQDVCSCVGNRTDVSNLEASWHQVEEWRKRKAPFQGTSGKKKKEFHVTKMCFSRQKQLTAVKGEIPQMVSSVATLPELKLACWNQFQDRDDLVLPSGIKISLTDNSKKKTIALVKNDAQLFKIQCIGYLCEKELNMEESNSDTESSLMKPCPGFTRVSAHSSSSRIGGSSSASSSITKQPHTRMHAKHKSCCHHSETPSAAPSLTYPSVTPLWDLACFHDVPKWDSKQQSSGTTKKSSKATRSGTPDVADQDIVLRQTDISSMNVDAADIKLLDVIGKGQFGRVYKALWKGLQVAVKEIPKGYGEPDLKEVDICRRLRHPNIVMLLGYAINDTDILIVMNYIKGQNLAVALGLTHSKSAKILDEKYNRFVLYTAAQGVAYLHEKGVIHQDVKPANVMLEEHSNKAILCDLGVGKVKDMTMITNKGANAGTLAYQHQEQLLGKPPTPSVDVYSFGVIAVEVYTRVPVWKGLSYHEVCDEIKKGKYPAFQEDKVPLDAQEVIHRCFQQASERPSITELLPLLEKLVGEIEIW